jgi:hypothetical protein
MFHSRKNLALSCCVALELISNDHTRDVGSAFQKFAEELLRGPLVAPALNRDVEYVALLIDGPPQIVMFTLDLQKYLIEVLLISRPRPRVTELIGIVLAKFAAPLPYRLIGHGHPTFQQELFDIPEAQAEPKV